MNHTAHYQVAPLVVVLVSCLQRVQESKHLSCSLHAADCKIQIKSLKKGKILSAFHMVTSVNSLVFTNKLNYPTILLQMFFLTQKADRFLT